VAATPEVVEVPIPQPSADVAGAVDLQTADQKRLEALQRAAREAANNSYVISDRTFTIFKDSTGQYITRFTSLRDGRVTYIPEPELLKSSNQTTAVSLLDIQA
jgi:hypothetical protein